ncbi:DUF808 domain-containing protein [Chachezhania sediminis]|uniref:DUF808 domain-containing protein n=1 Tax=Chachezhania sediminis TaxID=2599291 RepID=UPI00131CDE79|nr:DUF808 domain-containing protein [Chachezhania sediminis]
MSGLLALLDDVAGIAKVAAASVDDVAAQALKAGTKAAGAVIDDTAVAPKYLHGFSAARELPIVWKIAKGSVRNKLVFLLPAGLLLSAFADWAIAPLLMLGGCYLCFEGAEKIHHAWHHGPEPAVFPEDAEGDPAHLEETKAAGAIKTDFILSAEIMTIALAAIPDGPIWMEALTLAVVAVGITAAVYGSVALIVKADDIGLHLATHARTGIMQRFGRGLVRVMPPFMKFLTIVGTAAMLWVGGNIILHGFAELGFGGLDHLIIHISEIVGAAGPGTVEPALTWIAKAAMDGIFGLALGLALLPVLTRAVPAVWQAVTGRKPAE